MKKVGFIGAFDKTNLILYVSKIMAELGKKVLVVDTTLLQKARYIVPCIAPSKSYVTRYENFDVAVGFGTIEEIVEYQGNEEFNYDYILIDIDSNEQLYKMNLNVEGKNYFVTGFDSYSLKKGLEVIGQASDKIIMTKVMFSRHMLEEEEDYLDFLSFYYAVKWVKNKIYFPCELGDESIMIENQRSARIKFRELTEQYKEGLYEIVTDISHELNKGEVRKILKNI